MSASPMSVPKKLELSTAEIPQNTLPNDDPKQQLLIPINNNKNNKKNNNNIQPLPGNPPTLTSIPYDIFVQICNNLPPSDLLSLMLVCQEFKRLLCDPNSPQTQAIWRNSRTKFMRFLQSPPPSGMDEKSYIVLKQLGKGCQFCHKMDFIKVYWEFRVRCCEQCLENYTMR
jgi:hypothetical protein